MNSSILTTMDKYSKHARTRSGQRAIRNDAVNAVITYGSVYKIGRHDHAFWLNRKSIELCDNETESLERFANVAVVIMGDGCLKTLMHCCKKPHHWEKIT